ncbi:DUF397 domain-containing protein [Streptomyces gobiensis]|uniref:DUF397 domain-containing protein n=1 Tax=Streptomyces gobiensis TaxID=2875706 RepID=UPI001E57D2F6|nr:DUF397 domain-containing protein [Streptomyces gobiensis]UGY93049.1 DUF397 domain-containing protein [Streptomyces gobiensis]
MDELGWQKSSFSSGDPNTSCVEVATDRTAALHLRESDCPDEILTATHPAIRSLLACIKAGDLDHLAP